jgi:Fe-S-cluster containining protein
MDNRDRILKELEAFHGEVDQETAKLEKIHAERLECKSGCADCCVDDLSVFDVEAERIRRRHKVLLSVMTPHPAGACAFLDHENHCLIYDCRPYVCRTQGLPLSWTETRDDGSEYEGKLAELQRRWGNGKMKRVKLRVLPGG